MRGLKALLYPQTQKPPFSPFPMRKKKKGERKKEKVHGVFALATFARGCEEKKGSEEGPARARQRIACSVLKRGGGGKKGEVEGERKKAMVPLSGSLWVTIGKGEKKKKGGGKRKKKKKRGKLEPRWGKRKGKKGKERQGDIGPPCASPRPQEGKEKGRKGGGKKKGSENRHLHPHCVFSKKEKKKRKGGGGKKKQEMMSRSPCLSASPREKEGKGERREKEGEGCPVSNPRLMQRGGRNGKKGNVGPTAPPIGFPNCSSSQLEEKKGKKGEKKRKKDRRVLENLNIL